MLVLHVHVDGSWKENYYGEFGLVKDNSRYSNRDNKHMISISKLSNLVS